MILLALNETKLQHLMNDVYDYKLVDDTKAVLKYKFHDRTILTVVIQISERNRGQFMFVVFREVENRWHCIEKGYHHDFKFIRSYLTKKYLADKKVIGKKVNLHAN